MTLLLSDLHYLRMEATAHAGAEIANKAVAERRPLTDMEVRHLRLMDIEQTNRRRDWADVLRSEGRRVETFDYPDRGPAPGITVSNFTANRPTIWLYGDIGQQFGGITADDFRRALLEVADGAEIDLHVHSDGGDYHEGVAMHAMIQRRTGLTFGHVDGRACSAGTIPLMACAHVAMASGSWLMIHEARASLRDGKADDFQGAAESLVQTNEQIARFYAPRWKGTFEQLRAALAAETWISDRDAVALGLADSISEQLAIAASVSRNHKYKNLPSTLRIAARLEDCPNNMRAALCLHRLCAVR